MTPSDLTQYFLPADVKKSLSEIWPEAPETVMRGLRAASRVLFTADVEENKGTLYSISNMLHHADDAAQEYYQHNNGEMPEAVVTLLSCGPELMVSLESHDKLVGPARALLDEVMVLRQDMSQLGNANISGDAKFVALMHAHELALQSYEHLLSEGMSPEEDEWDTMHNSLSNMMKYFNPERTPLENDICTLIELHEDLRNNSNSPRLAYTQLTRDESLFSWPLGLLAEAFDFSSIPEVVTALELSLRHYSGNLPVGIPAGEDVPEEQGLGEIDEEVEITLDTCGVDSVSKFAGYYEQIIYPVRQLFQVYQIDSPQAESLMILYQGLLKNIPVEPDEDHDYPTVEASIDEDFAELVMNFMGASGERIVNTFRASIGEEGAPALNADTNGFLFDYNALCLAKVLDKYADLIKDKPATDKRLPYILELMERGQNQAQILFDNGRVFKKEVGEILAQAHNKSIDALIAAEDRLEQEFGPNTQKDNEASPRVHFRIAAEDQQSNTPPEVELSGLYKNIVADNDNRAPDPSPAL